MIAAITAAALIALAVISIAMLGPIVGGLLTVAAYGGVVALCFWLKRRTDPLHAYRLERATRPSATVSIPTTTPPRRPSATGPPF